MTTDEEVILRDNGIEVLQAPEYARISLELLASHGRGIRVSADEVTVGTTPGSVVVYQVVGWDGPCPLLRRVR